MLKGQTCDAAYHSAYDIYTKNINTLRVNGNYKAAAHLESNRDALVSPSTNAAYGKKDAKLEIKMKDEL